MMTTKSRTFLWIGLFAALVLSFIWQFAPLPDAKEHLEKLPLNGIGYKGKEVPLESFEKDFFKDVHILKRLYQVNGQNFFITALDGTHNRHVVHDPYYCFKGGGWSVLKEKDIALNNGNASLLVIGKDGYQREALFWFTNGKTQHNSPFQYWMQATLRRLTLGASGPEPVLVVVQPITDEPVDWQLFEKNFHSLFNL